MLLSISMPSDNERGPHYVEEFFNALHGGNARCLPVTLHYASLNGVHGLFIRTSAKIAPLVRNQLKAAYPNATIARLNDDALTQPDSNSVFAASLYLRPDFFPLRRSAEFDDSLTRERIDPLAGLLAALETASPGVVARTDLTVTPAGSFVRYWHRHRALLLQQPWLQRRTVLHDQFAEMLSSRNPVFRTLAWIVLLILPGSRGQLDLKEVTNRDHQRESDLEGVLDKLGRHLYLAQLRIVVFADPSRQEQAVSLIKEIASSFSQYVVPRRSRFELGKIHKLAQPQTPSRARRWLVSSEELASLWHPATKNVDTVNLHSAMYRQLEPPSNLPHKEEEEIAVLGRTNTIHQRNRFGLRLDDRRRHLAIVGKTGMGKSTLLKNLIVNDIRNHRGVVLLDPHGDLAEEVLESIPSRRTGDVVYFDAGDREFPIAFNPLSHRGSSNRTLVAAGVVASFKKLFSDSWGPRLEHILRNAILALLETPDTTLISLQRMLFDPGFCKGIVSRVTDPAVSAFWKTEWASWRENYRNEAIAPVLNKLGHFLSNPILRSIIGQHHSRVNIRQIIDNEQILIANLSKGRIGEDASNLLGSFLIASLQLAAMSRADVPEQDRRDCFLYVDEFQNFATDSFATILSEARKYRLNLTIANQYLEQVDEEVLAAVFGNAGSILSFQVGQRDAEALAEQFGGYVSPRDMIQLPKYQAYIRMLIEGASSRPFSMTTLPPISVFADRSEIVRKQSRQRFARASELVEQEISEQFGLRLPTVPKTL